MISLQDGQCRLFGDVRVIKDYCEYDLTDEDKSTGEYGKVARCRVEPRGWHDWVHLWSEGFQEIEIEIKVAVISDRKIEPQVDVFVAIH